jgi:hypothetical protein
MAKLEWLGQELPPGWSLDEDNWLWRPRKTDEVMPEDAKSKSFISEGGVSFFTMDVDTAKIIDGQTG